MAAQPWRVALITGASSGIGRQFARALAARGSDLVVVARRQQRLQELADDLQQEHGVAVEVLAADLTDPDELAAVERRLGDDDQPIDLLVNNAGFGTYGHFVDLETSREDDEVRLNVLAPTRLSHAALPGMVHRGHGAIVNVSSVAAFQPLPFNATYAATKAYLLNLSEALHEELHGTGVRVLALCPGFVRTEFHDVADIEASVIPPPAWLDQADVVQAALAALTRGQAVCVPGLGYKVLTAATGLTPRWITRKIAAAVTRRV